MTKQRLPLLTPAQLLILGLIAAIVSFAPAAFVGCGSGGADADTANDSSTTVVSDPYGGGESVPQSLDLTIADDGGAFEIRVGGIITLTLDANPSTGYSWEMNDSDPEASLLAQLADPVFESEDSEAAGAGGTLTYTFKAVDPGEMTVSLVYVPPGVDEEPGDTFEFNLIVH